MTDLKRGDMVIVHKGALVRSFNPSKNNYVTKSSRRVKVATVYTYDPVYHDGRKTEISWAGAGGYWCHTTIDNVVLF